MERGVRIRREERRLKTAMKDKAVKTYVQPKRDQTL